MVGSVWMYESFSRIGRRSLFGDKLRDRAV